MNNNISKSLSEVVSIDAWHASFDSDGRASVHVDLSFLIGEMGSEESSEVTFKLSLRRAVLKIIIPTTEGLAVIQSSVDREQTLEGVRKIIEESQVSKSGSIGFNAQLRVPAGVSADGKVQATKASARATSTEFTSPVSGFDIKQIVDSARNDGWEIRSTSGGALSGKVWDPVKRPRLSVKKVVESKLESSFRVSVQCRKGDLIIEGIKLKSGIPFFSSSQINRMAAAKAFIRLKLIEDGLQTYANDEDVVEILIAESTIIREVR